jgi:hypothetical protein
VATTLVVVVTANHYWMDGIVAALILAAVLAAQAGLTRLIVGVRRGRLPANVFGLRLLPYRPAWDHRGNNDPIGAGGTDGCDRLDAERDRAPAGCDRPT